MCHHEHLPATVHKLACSAIVTRRPRYSTAYFFFRISVNSSQEQASTLMFSISNTSLIHDDPKVSEQKLISGVGKDVSMSLYHYIS
jgi:hypothetical protein